ncbi:22374_t:CDS:2 [Entrophospora sp. SA101]|nr:22363_t:CDS:2 [Entrophospora sp. SA101]CAJ0892373.1 22370_t:CDS:2 [Entrophospora sp. SA101]CAJ0892421.1 22374_t:CDS:2 [Entrophospora sp. SA101]
MGLGKLDLNTKNMLSMVRLARDTNIGSSKQTLLNYKKCLKVDIPLYEFNELGKTEASSTKNLTNFIESLYL